MQIGSCISHPGKITKGGLIVGRLKNKKLEIPIVIAHGRREGQTCFISAGMHGDEINSIETINKFFNQLNINSVKGTIILLPLINPWGFKQRTRYIPFDNQDLNRCFNKPGRSISYEIAKTILKEVVS
ncbi:MAG TPA: succinylglutamate desuccinylase/aspartoacylase family protein, partial [Candidatus Nanoarchaeia archaeon]|nr:succinylglutamate desuccinylase/aspartoacylase family protein [Candidatus Nanoarchaeia archaeon]